MKSCYNLGKKPELTSFTLQTTSLVTTKDKTHEITSLTHQQPSELHTVDYDR
jgi:hypothetical protein